MLWWSQGVKDQSELILLLSCCLACSRPNVGSREKSSFNKGAFVDVQDFVQLKGKRFYPVAAIFASIIDEIHNFTVVQMVDYNFYFWIFYLVSHLSTCMIGSFNDRWRMTPTPTKYLCFATLFSLVCPLHCMLHDGCE